MPRHAITAAASSLIQELKAAGQSSRQVAEALRDRLGIELDQRTISRHVASIAGRGRVQVAKPSPKPTKRGKGAKRPSAEPPEGEQGTELPEVEALEREARQIQTLLRLDMPHRDRTALTGELRQTFAAIRRAKAAEREAFEAEDQDTAWVLAKLKRFDRMNRGQKDDDENGDPGLSEAAGAATS